jgi:hypothetical protein
MLQGLQPGIELVYPGECPWVCSDTISLSGSNPGTSPGPEAVAGGGHKKALPGLYRRGDGFAPEGEHPFHGLLEAFGARELLPGKGRVPRIEFRLPFVIRREGRGSMSKLRLQAWTCSSPYFSAISDLFSPWSAP